jgi:hypothetical protein
MDFANLTTRFCEAACRGGAELAALFTEDGVYHDGFYGEFRGRAAIVDMIDNHFQRDARDFEWRMYEPVFAGDIGYARYMFGYTSKIPGSQDRRVVFAGMSQFRLEGELIKTYTEIFDAGLGMAQLGFNADRMAKRARRAAENLRAQEQAETFLKGAPVLIPN